MIVSPVRDCYTHAVKGTKNDKRGSTCCDRWKWNWGSCCGQVPMTGSCHPTVVGVRFYTNETLTGYFTNAVAKTRGDPNSRFGCLPARPSRALYRRYRSGLSVPGHALRCGPETSVTSPLRGWELQPICCFCNCLEISIPSSKRWELYGPPSDCKLNRSAPQTGRIHLRRPKILATKLLAIMESARRWSTKWVELLRVLIPTQA
jgi:hypothetical protein